jgi:hypothetical protein
MGFAFSWSGDRTQVVLTHSPSQATVPRRALYSGHNTLARMTRLTHAAGIREQHWLAGTQATCATVAETIAHGVNTIDHDGLLVVTFSGHTVRKDVQTFWYLQDGEIRLGEIAARLAGAAASARLVVVADTCDGAALRRYADRAATLVLIAVYGEDQHTMNRPTSEFMVHLEQLIYPDREPECRMHHIQVAARAPTGQYA